VDRKKRETDGGREHFIKGKGSIEKKTRREKTSKVMWIYKTEKARGAKEKNIRTRKGRGRSGYIKTRTDRCRGVGGLL